jgi:hypothetical protein
MQARSAFAPPGEHKVNEQYKQRAISAKHLLWEVQLTIDWVLVVGNVVWVKWKEANAVDYIGR